MRPGAGRQRGALPKGAVPPLSCLGFLFRKRIGGVANQQVSALCGLLQRGAGGRVAGEYHAQPPARRAQHLRRGHGTAFHENALPLLQKFPLLHRHPQRPGPGRVEPACPGQLQPITHAGHPVPGGKGAQHSTRRPALRQRIQCQRPVCFLQAHGIGQRPGEGTHGAPDAGKPFRPHQQQRPGAALGPQRLQQTRQAEDVVAVIMGQTDGVRTHQVDPGTAGRRLGALAAVEQQAVAAAGCKGRTEGAVRQRHGGRRAQ